MRLPSRITEPSTNASTPSILAISGMESCVSLKRIIDVREITRRSWIAERRLIRASVIPSARYSWVESPERFFKGSTATDRIAGRAASVALPRLLRKNPIAISRLNSDAAATGSHVRNRAPCGALAAATTAAPPGADDKTAAASGLDPAGAAEPAWPLLLEITGAA